MTSNLATISWDKPGIWSLAAQYGFTVRCSCRRRHIVFVHRKKLCALQSVFIYGSSQTLCCFSCRSGPAYVFTCVDLFFNLSCFYSCDLPSVEHLVGFSRVFIMQNNIGLPFSCFLVQNDRLSVLSFCDRLWCTSNL